MMKPMDIKFNEDVAMHMRGKYSTDARRHSRCMEKATADLMKELEETGIVVKCDGPVDFLMCGHFDIKADGVRVRLVLIIVTA